MIHLFVLRFIRATNETLFSHFSGYTKVHYVRLANAISQFPKIVVLASLALGFVLSYPALYTLYTTPGLVTSTIANPRLHSVSSWLPHNSPGPPGVCVKQLWLLDGDFIDNVDFNNNENFNDFGRDSNISAQALSKKFLGSTLDLQQHLSEGIGEGCLVISPLNIWNDSRKNLENDKTHLHTLQSRMYSDSTIDELLGGVTTLNGFVCAANALKIMLVYNSEDVASAATWDTNLKSYQAHQQVFEISATGDEAKIFWISNGFSFWSQLGFYVAILSGLIYLTLAFANANGVKSRCGLALTLLVQICLSLLSAISVSCFLFDSEKIPIQFWTLIIVALENTFRLLAAVSTLKGSVYVSEDFSALVARCAATSSSIVIIDVAVLVLMMPFVSSYVRQFCAFAVVTLLVDHFLHLTFFTAVLNLDIRRLELQDLLTSLDEESRFSSRYLTKQKSKISQLLKPVKNSPLKYTFKRFLTGSKLPICNSIVRSCFLELVLVFVSLISTAGQGSSILLKVSEKFGNKVVSFEEPSFLELSEDIVSKHSHTSETIRKLVASTKRTFDRFFVLEFLASLGFVLAVTEIILRNFKVKVEQRVQPSLLEGDFKSRDLVAGHSLDVVKISSNRTSPFVVSIGMDHKVFVWSPAAVPVPRPVSLPVVRQIWPITHAQISMHGNLIAIFSKKGTIKIWSRANMSWICTVDIEGMNEAPLESFFRKKSTLRGRMRNKLLEDPKPTARPNLVRQSSTNAFQSLPPNHEKNVEVMYELVVVLKNGKLIIIDCGTGQITTIQAAIEELVATKLLVTPRILDRLVFATKSGKLVVGTVVNNQWKLRPLLIQEGRFNRGKGLMTPLSIHKTTMKLTKKAGHISRQSSIGSMTNVMIPPDVPPEEFAHSSLVTVSFVGMVVRTHGLTADLIDVSTGTLVRRFNIGQFKPGTFRVFHDTPTHCRFCGCVSISSFSIVYTELETGMVIMHTFSNSNRAKNSICLRVERDPRETRCLGLNAVTESQHWLEHVECWEITELNMIEGIRRKPEMEATSSKDSPGASGLRSRKVARFQESLPHLSDLWEGFTMNAGGHVSFHEIPNGPNEGLLVKKLSSISRFGHKSVIVPFGDIMKVLYLGNDDLIMDNLDEDGNNNQKISGLTFVNKRRMRRNELTNSTNYVDLNPDVGHEK